MKIGHLNEWFGFSANVGVLVGIIFLIVELQQTNRIAAVSSEYDIRNYFATTNVLLATDLEFNEFLIRVNEQEEELSPLDRSRASSWIYLQLNGWIAGTTAYENGVSSEILYNNMFDSVCVTLGFAGPSFRRVWREELDNFPALAETELWEFMYEVLDENSAHC